MHIKNYLYILRNKIMDEESLAQCWAHSKNAINGSFYVISPNIYKKGRVAS